MVGFFLMVGCSAGSKAVRKDRVLREENSSKQQSVGIKNGDLSQHQKKLGRPNNSPKEIFYAATSETCCGEDPHAVHGIETPDGGFVLTGKSLDSNGNGRDSLSSFQQISLQAHIGWTRRRKFLMSGPTSSGATTPKTEVMLLLRLRNRYLSQDLPPIPRTGCNVFSQSLI